MPFDNQHNSRSQGLPVIFMFEQDEDDRELTGMISKEAGFDIDFKFFSDRLTFFDALSISKPFPSVIILSYSSNHEDAIGVLQSLKSDKKFMHLPVVVLSDSITDSALQQAYQHGANSFIRKPVSNSDTENKISTFLNYWLNVVELPGQMLVRV